MSDASQREWRFYIDDMVDFARKVLAYTDGLDQAGFAASGLTYDATLRNLRPPDLDTFMWRRVHV